MWKDSSLSTIEQQSPEDRVYGLLRYMVQRYNASGGLIATLEEAGPTHLCAYHLGMASEELARVWSKYRTALEAGQIVVGDETLAPIGDGSLSGFVYLRACAVTAPEASISGLCGAIYKSLGVPPESQSRVLVSARDLRALETEDALNETGWCKTAAARKLGVSRKTVYLRIKEYNLRQSDPMKLVFA